MYDKILVPLDGSPTSERGFEEALALAGAMKSTLLLLHVVDAVPVVIDMVPPATWQEISDGLRTHGQGFSIAPASAPPSRAWPAKHA